MDTASLGVEEVSEDGNVVEVLFSEPGLYDFGHVVLDNFGCIWDTTVVVEVIENPAAFITAGPDQLYCNDALVLEGGFNTGEASSCAAVQGLYDFCYGDSDESIFTYCPDNPGDGTAMTLSFTAGEMEGFFDYITVYDGPGATSTTSVA